MKQKGDGIRLPEEIADKLIDLGAPFIRKYLESIAKTYNRCEKCGNVALVTAFEFGHCLNCQHAESSNEI